MVGVGASPWGSATSPPPHPPLLLDSSWGGRSLRRAWGSPLRPTIPCWWGFFPRPGPVGRSLVGSALLPASLPLPALPHSGFGGGRISGFRDFRSLAEKEKPSSRC